MSKTCLFSWAEVVCLLQSNRGKKSLLSCLLICNIICVNRELNELEKLKTVTLKPIITFFPNSGIFSC